MSSRGPGLFLQGLAVHGLGGVQLSDSELPRSVVEAAFRQGEELMGLIRISTIPNTSHLC